MRIFTKKKCVTAISVTLVIGLAISWFVAGSLIAPAQYPIGAHPFKFPVETVRLTSKSGGEIATWHIRSPESHGVVILLHGIRANRLSMVDRAALLYKAGYSVVMIDFQAHGESKGETITIGYREQHDVATAVEFARKQHPGEPIGVLGTSLGAASAVLASPLKVDALILESMFPDIRSAIHNRVEAQLGVFGFLPAEILLAQFKPRLGFSPSELQPIDNIAHVDTPVFIISGAADRHTTASESRLLFDSSANPKAFWLVSGAGHVDLYQFAGEQYANRVIGFLEKHMGSHQESPVHSEK